MHVVFALVRVSIDLDDQSGSNACEVGDIRTDWVLPTELDAKAFGPEPLPHSLLDTRHPHPQVSSSLELIDSHWRNDPPTRT